MVRFMDKKIGVKDYFSSLFYAFKIILSTNIFYPVIQIGLMFIQNTLPFISLYIFNDLMNQLSAENIDSRRVILTAVYFIAFSGIQMLCGCMLNLLRSILLDKMNLKCQELFIKKQLDIPMSFSDTSHGKDVIGAAQNEITNIHALFDVFMEFVCDIYAFIVAARILISFNIIYAVVFLVLIIPSCVSSHRETAVFDKFNFKNMAQNRFHSYYRQILTGQGTAKDVRLYNLTDPLKKRYFDLHNKYLHERKRLKLSFMKVKSFYKILQLLGMCSFLLALINAKFSNTITVGDLVMYSGIALTYVSKASDIANGFDNSVMIVRWLQPVFEFLNISGSEDRKDGVELSSFESLEFKNVYFKYPCTDSYVLKGVSFRINRNERVSLVGLNGAGKSTIVKILIGLYEVESGEILINGISVKEYSSHTVRSLFSVLLQDYPSYALTMRENIMLSDIAHRNDEKAVMSLRKAGFDDSMCDLDCYMTRAFDDKGLELSNGQWQKIAVARTYFKDAPIVILDEPSSALDAESEEQIFNIFSELSEDRTSLMITHHISGVRNSDKILVLDNGVIKESGNHSELMQICGIYKQMFDLQKSRYEEK